MRGFACAAHGDVAHRDYGNVIAASFQHVCVEEMVANGDNNTVNPRNRVEEEFHVVTLCS
mgnify:CR=1 FL=1